MFKHILVPTDGSPLSLKAAKAAVDLAKVHKARVTAIHVMAPYVPPTAGDGIIYYPEAFSPEEYKRAVEKEAQKAIAKVGAAAAKAKVRFDSLVVTHDQPWESIVNAARKARCDVIVMASHGRRGIAGLLLGSETTKVLTHSRTPVLVCR
ncbi:MAG TPA: universal stress protein [Usitatibacter sp.]|nr:universal stress protein [Usitatibacter sp.]